MFTNPINNSWNLYSRSFVINWSLIDKSQQEFTPVLYLQGKHYPLGSRNTQYSKFELASQLNCQLSLNVNLNSEDNVPPVTVDQMTWLNVNYD